MTCAKKLVGLFIFLLFFGTTTTVYAGMSSVVLTEYGVRRITGLSTAIFFGLFVSTLLVRIFWGQLVKGTDWPKPTLGKSFAATFLGGLLFFLVLVMIAGSRELLSPGAWVPDGILYKLAPQSDAEPENNDSAHSDLELARVQTLEKLRDHLQQQAKSENGLPAEIPKDAVDLWTIPFASGMRYEYHPQPDDGLFLVTEPQYLDGKRHGIKRHTFEIVELREEPAP